MARRKQIQYPRKGTIKRTGEEVEILGEHNPANGPRCYQVKIANGSKVFYGTWAIRVGEAL